MTYFLESWEKEYKSDLTTSKEIKSRLIVALGMLYEYLERTSGEREYFVDLEDYVTNIATRSTNIYMLYTSRGGEPLQWPPWRNNAKINMDDILMLAEAGLVYVVSTDNPRGNTCKYDEISGIVLARKGVDLEKVKRCVNLIRGHLGLLEE